MRVVIEDLASRNDGKDEVELSSDTTIRFEFGNTSLSCKLEEEGLKVYKINNHGHEEGRILTIGHSSNVVIVK